MREPTATLDARFSDPDATATPWPTTRAVLENAQLSWVTTVRADGRPHTTPLVAVWLDGTLHFCTGPQEQKAVNLAGNAHVAVVTGCNTWDEGLDVIVEGRAERVTDRSTLERLAAAWVAKWDGQWRYDVGDGGFLHPGTGTGTGTGTAAQSVDDTSAVVLVFAVRADKVLAFGKGSFSQTRYRPA